LEEFVRSFLIETREGLSLFESQLLALENAPDSPPILSSIFRIVHSIKGNAGFLGFENMTAVAHEGEDLLGKLRDGVRRVTPEIASGLLEMIDAMRLSVASIEATRSDRAGDVSGLVERLRALGSTGQAPPPVETAAKLGETPPSAAAPQADPSEIVSPGVERSSAASPMRDVERTAPIDAAAPQGAPAEGPAETTIRVDIALLDRLMNLVGELVLTRNQMLRGTLRGDDAMLQTSAQQLDTITTELQEGMMKTRMQPIRTIWSQFPRVVRDLSLMCGKSVKLKTEGDETELDRKMIEAIKDPITHLVRNAIDHGIEPAEARLAAGKPAEGVLRMTASHAGGMVNIDVSDDGAGIDVTKIRTKAVARGWISADQAERWSDRELLGLIFRPGFSTTESTTMVSGRGVGMDVVKNRVESIGGSVEATSRLGEGATIQMKIPLTLTIINALLVSSGGERLAIPQVNLVELIRLKGDQARSDFFMVHGAPVYRYREKLLALLDLNEVLGLETNRDGSDAESINIVVLQADRERFGLIVDRIDDAQEIVVRPLARQLKNLKPLGGATIMGDGRIALILDAFGLARLLGPTPDDGATKDADAAAVASGVSERRSLLLLRGSDGGRAAIPLEQVDRLEAFSASSIEWIAGRPVVQYRASILPLIDVSAWLAGNASESSSRRSDREDLAWKVVIHREEDRRVGLVFDAVLDVVELRIEAMGEPCRRGVLYTAALSGHATEVLDVPAIARESSPFPQTTTGV
jgi:two-component system, chemotaxis family, sensor kinase CheA